MEWTGTESREKRLAGGRQGSGWGHSPGGTQGRITEQAIHWEIKAKVT